MIKSFNLFYEPQQTWAEINKENSSLFSLYFKMVLFFAAIPPVCAYIGATYSGWQIAGGDVVKLTESSALMLSVAAYGAILVGLYMLAHVIRWMAQTYGADASLEKCFALGFYSCIPLFVVSIVSIYPVLWLDMLFTLVAIGIAVRLLYIGTPILMGIDSDRGFLFASSILTVGMVMSIGVLAVTVIFWGSGVAPVFTR